MKRNFSTKECVESICKKSGLSDEVVRRLLRATRDTVEERARQGKKTTIQGLCSFDPSIAERVMANDVSESYIRVSVKPSLALSNVLMEYAGFESDSSLSDDDCGILVGSIAALS